MNISHTMVAELSLNDAIRLYATVVVDDWSDIERLELHDRICELLKTNKEAFDPFNPFKGFSVACRIHSEAHAEQLIRHAIKNLEKGR